MCKPLHLLILVSYCVSSCSSYKNVPYFKDLPDSGRTTIRGTLYQELIIQPDDILSISVKTIESSTDNNFQINTPLNSLAPSGVSAPNMSAPSLVTQSSGYLVDKKGNIEIPFAGVLHLAGLTRIQARDTIEDKMKFYFKNPVIDVRFANFKITVIGEVARPASYTSPNEKVSIFDAISMAGDLTIYGKRENIVIMRDSGDVKNLIRLNLNSKNIILSPYFYLKQNDVVYVEPSDAKIASLDASKARNITIIASVLALLVVVASRVNF